jgi:hypothetical protein
MPFVLSVAAVAVKVAHRILMPTARDAVDDRGADAGSPCCSVTPSFQLWVGRLCAGLARKTAPARTIDSSSGLIPGEGVRVPEIAILWTREAYSNALRYLLAALRKSSASFKLSLRGQQ